MGSNSLKAIVCLLLFYSTAFGQKDRYMVFFKDKTGTPFTVDEPASFLSPRAIERRVRQSISITEDDLPVNPSYLQRIKDTGAEVYFSSRWMNGVLIQCEQTLIPTISVLPFVEEVALVGHNAVLSPNGRVKSPLKSKGSKAEDTDPQLEMIGIDRMHDDGFKGAGVIVAVLDAGFPGVNTAEPFSHLFDDQQINQQVSKDFVYNSPSVFQFDDHGTQVLSVISALKDGSFTGGAPEATFQLYVTEEVSTEYRVEEYNWLFAAERADSAGADVIQSSLGYYDFDDNSMDYLKSQMDGKTAIVTKAAQLASERGMVVVVSAGNEGNISWQIITAPADAEGVLAVGSVNSQLQHANSSSTGPTADQRIKPDVSAMGVNTSVILPGGNAGKASGTSLAAPLITSLVAGLWQKFPYMSNRQIMDAIRMSASMASNPNTQLGFGIPNYEAAVSYLNEITEDDFFEIYPNPSFIDSVKIRCLFPDQVGSCNVEFISVDGKSVYKTELGFSLGAAENSISTAHLSAGLYFIRLTWNEKNYCVRFVKA